MNLGFTDKLTFLQVPLQQWPQTRSVLQTQAVRRMAMAVTHVFGSLYEEVIPVGYQSFGMTTDNTFKVDDEGAVVLFDMYTIQIRRYHVRFYSLHLSLANTLPSLSL